MSGFGYPLLCLRASKHAEVMSELGGTLLPLQHVPSSCGVSTAIPGGLVLLVQHTHSNWSCQLHCLAIVNVFGRLETLSISCGDPCTFMAIFFCF